MLLLAAQNPFHLLRFAETAYTAGDVPLALRTFLCVVDMDAGRAARRAWWGVRLVRRPSLVRAARGGRLT